MERDRDREIVETDRQTETEGEKDLKCCRVDKTSLKRNLTVLSGFSLKFFLNGYNLPFIKDS